VGAPTIEKYFFVDRGEFNIPNRREARLIFQVWKLIGFEVLHFSLERQGIPEFEAKGNVSELFRKRKEMTFLKTFKGQQSQENTLNQLRIEMEQVTRENILLKFEVEAFGANLLGRNMKPDFGKAARLELLSLHNTKKKYVDEIDSIKSTITELEVLISRKREELLSKQKQRRVLSLKALESQDLDMVMKNTLKDLAEQKAKEKTTKDLIESIASKLDGCKKSLIEETLTEAELQLGYVHAHDADLEVQALKSKADILNALLLEKAKH
jgi:hypothetical protein